MVGRHAIDHPWIFREARALLDRGETILTDALPAGPTYGAPTVGNLVNVTNPGNIACGVAANVLTCTASGTPVTLGATTGAFRVIVPASSAVDGSFTNPGGACSIDPNDELVESDEADNACGPDTVVAANPRAANSSAAIARISSRRSEPARTALVVVMCNQPSARLVASA